LHEGSHTVICCTAKIDNMSFIIHSLFRFKQIFIVFVFSRLPGFIFMHVLEFIYRQHIYLLIYLFIDNMTNIAEAIPDRRSGSCVRRVADTRPATANTNYNYRLIDVYQEKVRPWRGQPSDRARL